VARLAPVAAVGQAHHRLQVAVRLILAEVLPLALAAGLPVLEAVLQAQAAVQAADQVRRPAPAVVRAVARQKSISSLMKQYKFLQITTLQISWSGSIQKNTIQALTRKF
jgi:hypothetical protein